MTDFILFLISGRDFHPSQLSGLAECTGKAGLEIRENMWIKRESIKQYMADIFWMFYFRFSEDGHEYDHP